MSFLGSPFGATGGIFRWASACLRSALRKLSPALPCREKQSTGLFFYRGSKSLPNNRPKMRTPDWGFSFLVRPEGFEPSRFPRRILSPLCMPFHHGRNVNILPCEHRKSIPTRRFFKTNLHIRPITVPTIPPARK